MTTNAPLTEDSEISRRLSRIESALARESASDQINLRQLMSSLWRGRWFVIACTVIGSAISVWVAITLPNEYKATVVLTPASSSSVSSLSRMAGQFSGLAALAGVSLGGSGESDKAVTAMELIKTWGFQERFIRENQLEVPVFAAKGWDKASRKLLVDSNVYDSAQQKWVGRFAGVNDAGGPSSWKLYEKLSKRISVSQDKKTNLIYLSVEHYSPDMAKDWVDKIVVSVNEDLRERDRAEAKKSIEYLKEKMSQTDLTEMKAVFSRLIEEQTKNLMLADVSEEYALKTLSPSKVPEEKTRPQRVLICVSGVLLGGGLGVFIWLIWAMFYPARERRN